MTAHTVFRPSHVDSIKFGTTDFSSDDFASATTALDTAFTTNNPGTPTAGSATTTNTVMLDLVGTRLMTAGNAATASVAYSEAFAKEISFSGNERSTSTENLLGEDTNGTQNQETTIEPTSLLEVTLTIVYRNPTAASIFNDNTKCCLMVADNEESSVSGVANWAFKSITVLSVGSLSLTPEGMMEQTVKFSCKGGTTGTSINVDTTGELWYRIVGGDYAEEIRAG